MDFVTEWEKYLTLIKQGLSLHPKYQDQFNAWNHPITVTQEMIEQYEQALNLRFPHSFRQYLLQYGNLYFYHCQIFGITSNINDQLPNVIFAQRIYQKIGLIKDKMIPLSTSADGSLYAIDTAITDKTGENPVIKINEDGKAKIAFDNFSEFLIKLFKDTLVYVKP